MTVGLIGPNQPSSFEEARIDTSLATKNYKKQGSF
jgi:hypothetical protein